VSKWFTYFKLTWVLDRECKRGLTMTVLAYLEPLAVAVAVSPYGWLMTHYGWLAG